MIPNDHISTFIGESYYISSSNTSGAEYKIVLFSLVVSSVWIILRFFEVPKSAI